MSNEELYTRSAAIFRDTTEENPAVGALLDQSEAYLCELLTGTGINVNNPNELHAFCIGLKSKSLDLSKLIGVLAVVAARIGRLKEEQCK